MAVYVDNFYVTGGGNYNGMKMSHMMADTTEELLAMVDKIGVQRKWIQKAGTIQEHFDIALSKRTLAIKNGTIEVGMRSLASWACGGRIKPLSEYIELHKNR